MEAALYELERPFSGLAWSALTAGLVISFSFLSAAFLGAMTDDPRLKHVLVAIGYPLGFIYVVLGSTQLFTENTLDPILPLLERRTLPTFRKVCRLWAILIVGNLMGALIMALLMAHTRLVPEWLLLSMDEVAQSSTAGGFGRTFFLAIFGGWLIALMSWLLNTTLNAFAQIVIIWMTTAPIAAFGFRHSVVGSVEAFFRAARGSESWVAMLGGMVAPAILGNAVGGVALVALLFYGQVAADQRQERSSSQGPPMVH